MAKQKKKQINNIFYLIIIIILAILSAIGIEIGTEHQKNTIINVVKPENLQNITIKTGETINKEFISEENKNLKVYFFDVGQADSILVMNENQTMLIDAGNNEDGSLLVKNLKTLGIKKIDFLIGTHAHEDHIGGMDDIINNFEIGTIYMPKIQTNTKTFEDVLDAVANKKLKIETPKEGDTFLIGQANCNIVAIDNEAKELNLSSIVIDMKFNNLSYLFMGDAEEQVEEKILKKNNLKANVLKVGHHGSNTSSSEKFLKAVAPEIAIISVEKGNTYGHPDKAVLKRLEKIGTKIYRTDEQGNIFIEQMKE